MKKLITTSFAIAVLLSSSALTYAGTFGLTPEQERATEIAAAKGEKFGKFLCTEFEAKAIAEEKSRRQIVFEAKVATMRAASREYPKDILSRAVFYDTAIQIHERFCNTPD